ncbi:ABC transporter permease [Streptomyces sp. TRM66268-LWL]|uniref:ABC transporter permease n=1 Tax=Streptomyces polyasparticus TaxID=2767826 RepID=A0ABR7SVN3_9ACTN|nr:ABC transporter permease [Streptomyces polyasparticus]MBC9719572.1 ABC transporter permease [Streptomyces polyasparticus]
MLKTGRMSPRDVLRTGASGLRTRPLRVFLSALGIAIGIAAMIGVVGISTSSHAELQRTLDRLGTNLLTAAPGQTFTGAEAKLPKSTVDMVRRIGPVESAASTGDVDGYVYRNDRIPPAETGSINVKAADLGLLATTGTQLARGSWLNKATARYPAVVLGTGAADRLGIGSIESDTRVWLGGTWFTLVGILDKSALAPELDDSALVGWGAAERILGFDGHPTKIYTRTVESAVEEVRDVLAATANPQAPTEVKVSRPSDALAAKNATDKAFTGLMLGLGAVALLVGGVGVANTMVISVLERRAEIGLRRSLGARRNQIRTQFLVESQLLAGLGGIGGVLLGIAVTAAYALSQGWPVSVPVWAIAGGFGATLSIGALAGLYPAVRASQLPPTEALGAA